MATPEEINVQIGSRPSFLSGAGSDLGVSRPLSMGEAFAFGRDIAGNIGNVSTNIPGAKASAESLGVVPRPEESMAIGRPDAAADAAVAKAFAPQTGPALSQDQQEFLAGRATNLSSKPLLTPVQQKEAERRRKAAVLQDRKNFALERVGEPARVAGEQARQTENVRQEGRVALATLKGEIRERLNDATLGSRERIAALNDAREEAEGRLDRAARSNDVATRVQAEKDIANIDNTARLERLQEQGALDIAAETAKFVNQARLQAQREGTDLKVALVSALKDPFVSPALQDAIARQGIDNIVQAPEAVEIGQNVDPGPGVQETTIVDTPQGSVAEQTTVDIISPEQARRAEEILANEQNLDRLSPEEERTIRERLKAFKKARGR